MSLYTKNTWTDNVTPVDKAHMDIIENGVLASQFRDEKAAANGYASLDATTKIPFAQLPTTELAYVERTTNFTTTAVATASADVLLTLAAVTFDGATKARVEFSCFEVFNSSANVSVTILLFEDGVHRTYLGRVFSPSATQGNGVTYRFEFTPASGSRTYSIRTIVGSGTGNISAGAGTGATIMPIHARIVRV